jgi:hypothetical protein
MARNPLRHREAVRQGNRPSSYTAARLSEEPQGVYNAAWPQVMRPPTIKDSPMTERYHLISSVT